ncbi:MAG: CBS domain-containing protein [Thermodesulfovibrionales bacterium]
MKAYEMMNKNVITIGENATVAEAVDLMLKNNIRRLVVEPAVAGDPFGMISVRDVVYKAVSKGLDVKQTRVKQIMTRPLVTINPNLEANYVADLLRMANVNGAPVIGEHRLMGIISVWDVMKTLAK